MKKRNGYLMVPILITYEWADEDSNIKIYDINIPSEETINITYKTLPIVYKTINDALEDRFKKD